MVLTAVGGAIGLAISWAICSAVPAAGVTRFVGTPVLSPQLALLTAGILGLVGLVGGLLPGPRGVTPRPRHRDEAVARREMFPRLSTCSISGLGTVDLDRQPPLAASTETSLVPSPEIETRGRR